MNDSSSTEAPILSIWQLTQAIKLNLESTFPLLWLKGEISNCKQQSSGHLYFCLKDSQAQVAAVMFRGDLTAMKKLPKDGDQVIVRGELNVYPPTGRYQVIVRELRLAGVGELLLKLEELKLKIRDRGWFRPEHKKPLPKFPKVIGVVTSPTGAVIQDILNILTRRFYGFHLILNPVKVQGEGAAQEIAQAIRQFNHHQLADVLIVGRGGGSIEDLWAFNEEIVAEAIFHSCIPILSAVGHETDHCIADYVADVRAPTPSAAAEMVIAEKAHYLGNLEQTRRRLVHALAHQLRKDRHRLGGVLRQPLLQSPYTLLGPWMQRLDGYRDTFDEGIRNLIRHHYLQLGSYNKQLQALQPSAQLRHMRQKSQHLERSLTGVIRLRINNLRQRSNLETKRQQLYQTWMQKLQLQRERLGAVCRALYTADPQRLLAQGYCIAFAEKSGNVITSITAVSCDQDIKLLFADGSIKVTAKEVVKNE